MLGGEVEEATDAAMFTSSGGNPLLLCELVRGAIDHNSLRVRDGRWHWDERIGRGRELREAVSVHLASLGPPGRRAVSVLALAEPLGMTLLSPPGARPRRRSGLAAGRNQDPGRWTPPRGAPWAPAAGRGAGGGRAARVPTGVASTRGRRAGGHRSAPDGRPAGAPQTGRRFSPAAMTMRSQPSSWSCPSSRRTPRSCGPPTRSSSLEAEAVALQGDLAAAQAIVAGAGEARSRMLIYEGDAARARAGCRRWPATSLAPSAAFSK